MSRQTFFKRRAPLSLGEIAHLSGADIGPGVDAAIAVEDVAPIDDAGPGEITFIADRRRAAQVDSIEATACFIAPQFADRLPVSTGALLTGNPELAFAHTVAAFYPDALRHGSRTGITGPGLIDQSARLEEGVEIEPGAVIGAGVEIGRDTLIGANAVVCANVTIGRECTIGANVTIMHALIGDQVIIHSGAVIGTDGFGFAAGARGLVKIPQIGRVIIQNGVEVGANAAIDRGALADTVIGAGTKIDNLVQIGHNVSIGLSCAFASQTGVAGSTTIGNGVLAGGQVGIAPHVTIGDGVQIGAGSGVSSNVAAGVQVMGYPHRQREKYFRELKALSRLARKGPDGA